MINRKILLILLAFCSLSSCTYYTHLVDVPLIHKKNDIRINAGATFKKSLSASIAYGLTDKFAMQFFASGINGLYFQGSTGYYKNLNNNKVFELYGGFGYGYMNSGDDPFYTSGKFQQYFAQLNFGKINCNVANADFGIGIKTGLLHSYASYNKYSFKSWEKYTDNQILLEPLAFLRLGSETFKFNFKVGGCWLYKLTHKEIKFPYSNWNIGIGLCYSI